MLLETPRRYCRNLTAFIISKPPCVVFTICLCCLAIALFWLGYYVNNNEIVDPEAEKVCKMLKDGAHANVEALSKLFAICMI